MAKTSTSFKKGEAKGLSKKWQSESLKVQFREIAHSIRNEYFNAKNNPRNNTLNAIKRITQAPALFDSMPFIRNEKIVEAGLNVIRLS